MSTFLREGDFELIVSEDQMPKRSIATIRIRNNILSDKNWAANFGKIERHILEKLTTSINELQIDLRRCIWADPIPTLGILLLSKRIIQLGIDVIWTLKNTERLQAESSTDLGVPPIKVTNTLDERAKSTSGRLNKFLAKEGFLSEAIKAGVKIVCKFEDQVEVISTIESLEKLINLPDTLAYSNTTIIPVRLLNLPIYGEEARAFVSLEVDHHLGDLALLAKLQSAVGFEATEGLLASLRLILTETLLNIAEHAYKSEDEFKFGAYFVRLRNGVASANQAQRDALRSYLDAERRDSPRIGNSYLTDRRGCLEVYICDSGDGLVSRLIETRPDLYDKKNPFTEYVRRVLLDGISSNSERRTEKGALSLIYSNAARRGDYIRCLGDGFWLGTACPMPRERSQLQELANSDDDSTLRGLYWHFRIGWDGATDDPLSWYQLDSSSDSRLEILSAYRELLTSEQRAQFLNVQIYVGRDAKPDVTENHTRVKINNSTNSVWQTSRNLIKNEILNRIETIAASETIENRTLFIVDIEPYEAAAYQWALQGLRVDFRRGWTKFLNQVVLVTSEWKVSVFQREDSNYNATNQIGANLTGQSIYQHSKTASESFFTGESKNTEKPNAHWLAQYLKWYSSKEFWKLVSHNNRIQPTFFNGIVKWGNESDQIDGYLDFGEVAQLSACRAILTRELTRYRFAISSNPPPIFSIDSFSASILEQMAGQIVELHINPQIHRLAVGSVLVTGSTMQAYALNNCTSVHFLAHPESAKRKILDAHSLLYWPIGDEWFSKHFPRKTEVRNRIGKTAATSLLGSKTYELPRYSSNGKTLSARSPADSYRDFQELPTIIRTGHWTYGAHHDLITPNIRVAIDRSLISGTGALIYVGCCICKALSISDDQLTELGKNAIQNALKTFGDREEFNIKACAIVYPTHGNATYLIDSVIAYFVRKDFESQFRIKIVGLGNIRTSTQRLPILPSPTAIDRIKELLVKSKGEALGAVLIVDDAVVTGKTHTEINALLFKLKAIKTETLVLFDRQRLPGGKSPVNKVHAYWKIDIPPIGERESCPVCNATDDFRTISASICSSQLKKHFRDAADRWQARDTNREWHQGLPSTSVGHLKMKYGLVGGFPIENPSSQVTLTNSTASALLHVELETMTGLEVARQKILKRIGIDLADPKADSIPRPEDLVEIEITATVSLFFSSVSSPARRIELFESLFRSICVARNSGDHTSFACLAIHASFQYLTDLNHEYFDGLVRRHVPQDTDALSDDARMLLASLLQKGLVSREHEMLGGIIRLLSPATLPLANLYNLFHNELLSPIGTTHSRPLAKLAEGRTNFQLLEGGEQSSLREAMDSADFMSEFCICLPVSFVRPGNKSTDSTGKDLLALLRDQCHETRTKLETADRSTVLVTKAAESCTKLLELARELRGRIFKTPDAIDKLVMSCQSTAIHTLGKLARGKTLLSATTLIDSPIRAQEERWIVWDSEITILITDILGNASRFSAGDFLNPWSKASSVVSSTWYRLHFTDTGLKLFVANRVQTEFNTSELLIKNGVRFRHLNQIGGMVDFEVDKSKINPALIVGIFIPYAGLCKSS